MDKRELVVRCIYALAACLASLFGQDVEEFEIESPTYTLTGK